MFAKSLLSLVASALLAQSAAAAGVVGTPEGFAAGTTGGGTATPVYPSTTAELVSYLGDNQPRVIVLSKTFDFRGTEGTASETGCAPWGTGSACQTAINKDDWCKNYQASAPSVKVSYDKAGLNPIKVASNKSLVGEGGKGVIVGKGLRLANGVKNVIIQNIKIEYLNPQYVWGGDAITLAGTDLVWIDHVTTRNIGRQHLVLGTSASGRVSVTNNDFDGRSNWSATCNGQHYWTLYFTGSQDQITFKGNYIHDFSGRAPKVSGNTMLHAVNNYWSNSAGHGFEIDAGAYVLAEGNVFNGVKAIQDPGNAAKGQALFVTSGNAAQCKAKMGRNCEANSFVSSGAFSKADTGLLGNFGGAKIASVVAAGKVSVTSAGYAKI